jgi:hypothetical protein
VKKFGFQSGFGTDTVTDTRVIEYVLKITHSVIKMDIFNIFHTKVYVFTCEHYRIGQEWKKCSLNCTLHTM